jgi:hypothetical protein
VVLDYLIHNNKNRRKTMEAAIDSVFNTTSSNIALGYGPMALMISAVIAFLIFVALGRRGKQQANSVGTGR